MRIAQVAPLTEAIPPKLYGGTERVVYWLIEELVALGHNVTLFASGDSCTSAKLEAFWPRALRLDGSIRDPNALHMAMLEQVRRQANEFDFLHFHLDYYPFSLFARQSTPFLTTLHGRLDLPEHQPVFDTFSSAPVVSISNSQRRPLPQARWIKTIHHGLPDAATPLRLSTTAWWPCRCIGWTSPLWLEMLTRTVSPGDTTNIGTSGNMWPLMVQNSPGRPSTKPGRRPMSYRNVRSGRSGSKPSGALAP